MHACMHVTHTFYCLEPSILRGGCSGTWLSMRGVRAAGSTTGHGGSLVGMQDLLRHRSEAGLEALELGPLIGRGSFGRVYKGARLQYLGHICCCLVLTGPARKRMQCCCVAP